MAVWRSVQVGHITVPTVLWLMSRTAYFFLRGNPIQFKITAIVTVCWDLGMFTGPDLS